MKEEPLETRCWEGALRYSWQYPRPPPRVARGWKGCGEGVWGCCITQGEATSCGFVLRVVWLHWESLSQMHPIDAIPEQGREKGRGWARWGKVGGAETPDWWESGPQAVRPPAPRRVKTAERRQGQMPGSHGATSSPQKQIHEVSTTRLWGLGHRGCMIHLPLKSPVVPCCPKVKSELLRGSTCCWVRFGGLDPSLSPATINCVITSNLHNLSGSQLSHPTMRMMIILT